MLEFTIILLEVLAFAALMSFAGMMESKYYELKPIKFIEVTKWVTLAALIVILFPAGVHVRFLWAHILFHLSMIAMCYIGRREFLAMRFKYPPQYRTGRWLLYASILLEILAVSMFGWYLFLL